MNRRALITGAAAMAASAVVPVALARMERRRRAGLEQVNRMLAIFKSLPPAAKVAAADDFRQRFAGDETALKLADCMERIGRAELASAMVA